MDKPLLFVLAHSLSLFVNLLLTLLQLLALGLQVHKPVAQRLYLVFTRLLVAGDLLVSADVDQELVVFL